MIHVHDGGKTVAENSSAVYRLLVLQRLESQNEVEFALLQSVHQFLHGAVLDVELYMRIGVEKGDERLGHDVAEGERYADVQFACKHFLQIVYGRTQSAFSEDGLPVGAGLEDLGKGLRSQVGTMYGTLKKGPRYLEMAEGYVTGIALDADDEIIGYQFVSLGKMTDFIKKGDDPNTAWEKAKGQYGRVADAVKIIDPRKE